MILIGKIWFSAIIYEMLHFYKKNLRKNLAGIKICIFFAVENISKIEGVFAWTDSLKWPKLRKRQSVQMLASS